MFEDREQLEFAISRYLDGDLSPAEHEALEARLKADPEAAVLLREYRELESFLRAPAQVPNLNWDALAQHISDHVDAPPASYRLPWVRVTAWAVAACLAIAGSIAAVVLLERNPQQQPIARATPAKPESFARVTGPAAERSTDPKVVRIAIGPSPTAQERYTDRAAQAIVVRNSSVVIQADAPPLYADNYRGNPFD